MLLDGLVFLNSTVVTFRKSPLEVSQIAPEQSKIVSNSSGQFGKQG